MKKFVIVLGLVVSFLTIAACANKTVSEPVSAPTTAGDYKGEVYKAK